MTLEWEISLLLLEITKIMLSKLCVAKVFTAKDNQFSSLLFLSFFKSKDTIYITMRMTVLSLLDSRLVFDLYDIKKNTLYIQCVYI